MVGLLGEDLGTLTTVVRDALVAADVVAGGLRLLEATASLTSGARRIPILGDVGSAMEDIASSVVAGRRVCVIASGDPGWFGIVRALAARFGPGALAVHPAPSSVSVAFARLGLPWDDAVVVSAHGRRLAEVTRLALRCPKVAILTGPDARPNDLGAALVAAGATHEHAAVCVHLGLDDEQVSRSDLAGLAAGVWDHLAVVVLWSGSGVRQTKSLAWGLPESAYARRGGMITKSEVRSVVLARLALPGPSPDAVLWDIGAGSGSVAIECSRVAPWLEIIAIEQDVDAAATCAANARQHGVAIRVATGRAPDCLIGLPDPDRVFVGGGGLEVLAAACRRLRPGGTVVATHAALDRASAAADLLGNIAQVTANRGRRLPDGGWRLEAANPVFITWGGR